MSTHVQVLSTATPDSSPCVMVATEHERHLFNAGEGTQRLCMEHRVRIVKTDNVFLTHIDADTVGGLPGLILTLGDAGKKSIALHGPPGLSAYLNAARSFMRPNGCALCCEEASPATADETAELFVTPELRVHKVLVRTELPAAREAMAAAAASAGKPAGEGVVAAATRGAGPTETPEHALAEDRRREADANTGPAKRVRLEEGWRSRSGGGSASNGTSGNNGGSAKSNGGGVGIGASYSSSRSHGGGGDCGSGGSISRGGGGSGGLCCMCYVCETPESPGKFNASRAAELGIPRGPLYGQLKCGRPVTLDDGRVIQPSEVVADSVPPAAAAIVACPSPALIGPLAAHPHWRRYMPLPRPAAGNAAAGTAAAGAAKPQTATSAAAAGGFGPVNPGGAPAMAGAPANAAWPAAVAAGRAAEGASTPKSGSPGVNGGNGGGQLRFMIHLAADEIISAPEYQAWCRRFGPGVAHVVASARRCGAHTPFLAALSTARKLNSLCPDVFPVPRQFPAGTPRPAGAGSRTPLGSRAATAAGGTRAALPPLDYGGAGVVPAAPLLKCHLYPPGRIRIDASEALATERISAGYEAPALTGAAAAAAAAAGLPAALEQLATARSAANSPAKGSIFGRSAGTAAAAAAAAAATAAAEAGAAAAAGAVAAAAAAVLPAAAETAMAAVRDSGTGAPDTSGPANGCAASGVSSCGDAGRATNIAAAPLSSTNGAGTVGAAAAAPAAPLVDAAALGAAALLRAAKGVELAFLGTGSAIPSKYRNVSGIYLCLGADGAGMLMDCGEGTMGQLWRMFGDDSGGGGGGTSGGSVGGSGGGSGSGSRSGGGSGGDGRKSSGTARVAGTGGDGSGGSANGSGGGGSGGAAAILRGLKVVWISHHHADHHLGLIRVLKERERALAGTTPPPEPLLVIGPADIGRWLRDYHRAVAISSPSVSPLSSGGDGGGEAFGFSTGGNNIHVGCGGGTGGSPRGSPGGSGGRNVAPAATATYRFVDIATTASADGRHAHAAWLESRLGLTLFRSVPVVHCPQAYALVVRHRTGWKLVYSGDTRPCNALVAAGAGATVLIHEATFDDGKADEALDRRHSTTSEALDVASRMGAFRTILTHFSQRYPKLPQLPRLQSGRFAVAFDFMRVRLPDLLWVPALLPALQCIFPAGAAGADEEAEDADAAGLLCASPREEEGAAVAYLAADSTVAAPAAPGAAVSSA